MKNGVFRFVEIRGENPLSELVAHRHETSIAISRYAVIGMLILCAIALIAGVVVGSTWIILVAFFLAITAMVSSLVVDMREKQLRPLAPGQFTELVDATYEQHVSRQRFQNWLASGRTIRQRDFERLMVDSLIEKDQHLKTEMWKQRTQSIQSLSASLS